MKLLLPFIAVLGLLLAACSGGEAAIEVEVEIEDTTTTITVAPATTSTTIAPTTTSLEEVVVPTTTIVAPTTTTTAVAVEPVGDGEQVVIQTTIPRSTETVVPTPGAIVSRNQEEWNNNYLITQFHDHTTVDGETESHSHEYVKPASSHFHREGTIIYLTTSEEEFVREDIHNSFWSPSGELTGGSVQCIEYCGHIDLELAYNVISTEIVTRVGEPTHKWTLVCPSEEAYEKVLTPGSEFENDPLGAGCELTERVPVE